MSVHIHVDIQRALCITMHFIAYWEAEPTASLMLGEYPTTKIHPESSYYCVAFYMCLCVCIPLAPEEDVKIQAL